MFMLCTFLGFGVSAQDTLDQVLQNLKINQTSQFSYKEIRELQLLTTPWQGTGELYISPDRMIIKQNTPKQIDLLITARKVHYVDTRLKIHKIKNLENPFEMPQMGLFLDLLFGDHTAKSLGEKYSTRFISNNVNWQIHLTPIENSVIQQMDVQGMTGHSANQLVVEFKDGDTTTWTFSLNQQGESAEIKMQAMVKRVLESRSVNNQNHTHPLLK